MIRCTGCVRDDSGRLLEIHAEYDPNSRGGNTPDGRRVKATIHWVDSKTCVSAEVRLYDSLFTVAEPDLADCNYLDFLNPESLKVMSGAKVEKSLADAKPGSGFQFLRLGYFCADSKDSSPERLVFNRSVSLKDSYKS